MGLFDKIKKQKIGHYEQAEQTTGYVSNIGLQQLGFMEQLDRPVVMVSDDQNIGINHAIHVCITQEALEQTLQKLKQEKQK